MCRAFVWVGTKQRHHGDPRSPGWGQMETDQRSIVIASSELLHLREGLRRNFSIERVRIDEFGESGSIVTFGLSTTIALQNYPPQSSNK